MKLFRKNEADLENKIKQLTDKLDKMENVLQELVNNVDIHIENLNVDHPVLENLTFKLDSVDIKELSGALNLGNNFGVDVKKKPKQKQEKQEKQKEPEKKEPKKPGDPMKIISKGKLEKKTRGYSFRFND